MYSKYLLMGLGMLQGMQEHNQQELDEILDEWDMSASYPRKKKKRVRKHLLVKWSIFSYAKDMFNF